MISIYKKSKYNYLFTLENKKFIFNTANQCLSELSQQSCTAYEKFSQNNIQLTDAGTEEFVQNGYFVEEWVDEMVSIQFKINQMIYSKNELFIMILPTDGCNFNCIYCSQTTKINTMNDYTKERLISFIKKQSKEYKKIRINWFGGEPLLEKECIIQIMAAIKNDSKIKVPILGDITTNGYLLDLETFELLTKNNVLYYQITLDGLANRHNRTRPLKSGDETYKRIWHNLLEIKNKMKSYNFKIVVRTNIDGSMLNELDEFIELCADTFRGDSRFLFYPKLVVDMGGKKIEVLKDSLLKKKMTLYDVIFKMKEKGLSIYDEFTGSIADQVCFVSRVGSYVINYDGVVFKCNNIIDQFSEHEIKKYNKICDLISDDKVDQHKIAKWVVRNKMNEKCNCCFVYPLCQGGQCCAKYHMEVEDCLCKTDYLDVRLKLMILFGNYSKI